MALAKLLRSGGNLQAVLGLCIRFLFEEPQASEIVASLQSASGAAAPSAATISRSRFNLDLLFMLWYQQFWSTTLAENNGAVHVFVSPQPGA